MKVSRQCRRKQCIEEPEVIFDKQSALSMINLKQKYVDNQDILQQLKSVLGMVKNHLKY